MRAKSPVLLTWLVLSYESVGFLVQEKKFNIDFQDGMILDFS